MKQTSSSIITSIIKNSDSWSHLSDVLEKRTLEESGKVYVRKATPEELKKISELVSQKRKGGIP